MFIRLFLYLHPISQLNLFVIGWNYTDCFYRIVSPSPTIVTWLLYVIYLFILVFYWCRCLCVLPISFKSTYWILLNTHQVQIRHEGSNMQKYSSGHSYKLLVKLWKKLQVLGLLLPDLNQVVIDLQNAKKYIKWATRLKISNLKNAGHELIGSSNHRNPRKWFIVDPWLCVTVHGFTYSMSVFAEYNYKLLVENSPVRRFYFFSKIFERKCNKNT